MERIEYRDVVSKDDWKKGPWNKEPDKIQWQDAATGLPCLIVRGPVGALCGYVGVMPGHPLYGVSYHDCPQKCGKDWCEHRPETALEAHGGVTFAGECADQSREQWEDWRKCLPRLKLQAKQFPIGDAARDLKEWDGCFDDYNKWKEQSEARKICYKPAAGEPDNVWWFGFDCAHLGDVSPGLNRIGGGYKFGRDETYKTVKYVTNECETLARQLNSIKGGIIVNIVNFFRSLWRRVFP